VKLNGGGSSTPPPGTGGDSNGGRTPSERGGSGLQQSDDSEREKKRARLGSGAAVVCSSTASKGPFYRHGRARESGFQIVAEAGKITGTAAPLLTFGRGDGSGGYCGSSARAAARSLTSATANAHACWSGDREATVESFHRPLAGVRAS
jgi:hypothetical protein